MNYQKSIILFIGAGLYSLSRRDENDKFKYFTNSYSCIYLTPVDSLTQDNTRLSETKITDNFTLIPFPYYLKSALIRNILLFYNVIIKAFAQYLVKKRKFKIVISENPLITGICAIILSRITKAKSIIEVNGDFGAAFKYGRYGNHATGRIEKLKEKMSKYIIRYVLSRADMIRLLYAEQLDSIFDKNEIDKMPVKIFSDYVPIEYFLKKERRDEKYILMVGYPWYLKGVDILIKAFNKISLDFPTYSLKIIGWCPKKDRRYFEDLANNNRMIELLNPIPYKEIIPYFLNSSIYVLASRTEAMGKVLLEAMASKKPIVASNVGGVNAIIKNDFNGLLFEKENVDDLAKKIRLLLNNKEYANRLALNGYKYVKDKLSEKVYINNYNNMINRLIGDMK